MMIQRHRSGKRPNRAVVASRSVTNSIIGDSYRETYRNRGNPSHCGDWLALTLEDLTHDQNGEFDANKFTAICELNGIFDHFKYDQDSQGGRGRFRMSCGARLRAIVRKNGVLYTPKGRMFPPADTKH